MKNLILAAAAATILAGCSTITPKDLNMQKLAPRERVYIGRVLVNLNGQPAKNCELYVNNDLTPLATLNETGYVYYRTDRLRPRFSKIACYHQVSSRLAAWHMQELPLSAVERPEDQKEIIYFGEIKVDWNIDPRQTTAAAEAQPQTQETLRVGQVKDSGEIRIQISSDFNAAERKFYSDQRDAKATGFSMKEQLVKIQ